MDELVKRLRNCVDSLCGECKYQQLQKPGNFVPCMNAMITEAADAIEELSKPRWIPVTERLPEDRVEVLVSSGMFAPLIEVACYDGLFYSAWDGETEIAAVTHWMPLPEPPKEET